MSLYNKKSRSESSSIKGDGTNKKNSKSKDISVEMGPEEIAEIISERIIGIIRRGLEGKSGIKTSK